VGFQLHLKSGTNGISKEMRCKIAYESLKLQPQIRFPYGVSRREDSLQYEDILDMTMRVKKTLPFEFMI